MLVFIRTDASYEIGSGHVMRCLTLADSLLNKGMQVEFICRDHKGNLNEYIEEKGFKVNVLPSENNKNKPVSDDDVLFHSGWLGVSQLEDAAQCQRVLNDKNADWLIVDHYALDKTWERALNNNFKKLMVIDDLADREHVCDVLLDQTFGREAGEYQSLVPAQCKMLLGSRYALLRPEFLDWREYSLARREMDLHLNSILISMGGMDPDNITEKVLKELKSCNLNRGVKVTVVLGVASTHLENIKQLATTLPYEAEVKINVSNIAEIMANTDLAIGAAGATSWERCCLGLPSILWVLAENQKLIAENLQQKSMVKILKSVDELCIVMDDIKDKLHLYSTNTREVTSGLGTRLVTEVLINE